PGSRLRGVDDLSDEIAQLLDRLLKQDVVSVLLGVSILEHRGIEVVPAAQDAHHRFADAVWPLFEISHRRRRLSSSSAIALASNSVPSVLSAIVCLRFNAAISRLPISWIASHAASTPKNTCQNTLMAPASPARRNRCASRATARIGRAPA